MPVPLQMLMSLHGYLSIGTLTWLTTFALGNRKCTVMVPESWDRGSYGLTQLLTNPAPLPPHPPTQTLPHSLWVCPLGYQILTLMCSKSFALTSHSRKISRGKNLKIFFLLDALGVFPDLSWHHLDEVPRSASHQGSTGVETSSVVSGFPPGEGELSWGRCEVHFHISSFKLRITDLCPQGLE